jgi:hypothetical protein
MQIRFYGDCNWLLQHAFVCILYHVWVTEDGVGLLIGFINNLQVVTTINYYTTVGLHNAQSLHTDLFTLAALVFSLTESQTPNKASSSHNKSSLADFSAITHCYWLQHMEHIKSSNQTLDPHRPTSCILLYFVRMLLLLLFLSHNSISSRDSAATISLSRNS